MAHFNLHISCSTSEFMGHGFNDKYAYSGMQNDWDIQHKNEKPI